MIGGQIVPVSPNITIIAQINIFERTTFRLSFLLLVNWERNTFPFFAGFVSFFPLVFRLPVCCGRIRCPWQPASVPTRKETWVRIS